MEDTNLLLFETCLVALVRHNFYIDEKASLQLIEHYLFADEALTSIQTEGDHADLLATKAITRFALVYYSLTYLVVWVCCVYSVDVSIGC